MIPLVTPVRVKQDYDVSSLHRGRRARGFGGGLGSVPRRRGRRPASGDLEPFLSDGNARDTAAHHAVPVQRVVLLARSRGAGPAGALSACGPQEERARGDVVAGLTTHAGDEV